MASNPAAPIRDVADSTSDSLSSPDNLKGVQDRLQNMASATPDSPTRPGRSPARGGIGGAVNGLTSAAGTGATAASNLATDAYNGAPDLGISSTANSAYQRAPDLGVGAAISSVLGGNGSANGTTQPGQAAERGNNDDEDDDERIIRSDDKPGQSQGEAGYDRRKESEQAGPSSKDRVGKSQQELGTETGIPTQAGAGTTVSPDQTNRKALEKATSQGKIHEAHVPEDFEATPCPTDNAGTGKSKGVVIADDSVHREAAPSSSSSSPSSPKTKGNDHSRRSSSQFGGSDSRGNNGVVLSDGSPVEMERKRNFGEKFKDQVKGEIKILAGTVTGKDDKINQGLAIKHGEHRA